MQDIPWTESPWQTVNLRKLTLDSIAGYLSPVEKRMFYWFARSVYTGKGEIVDAGAFLGASAACFAAGLRDNDLTIDQTGRIYSFDLFRMIGARNPRFTELAEMEIGQSFLHFYHQNVGKALENYLTLYPGDLTQRSWRAGAIEILMVDCCKALHINTHCMRMFFPHLSPGAYLIQQDYAVRSRLYWIHLSMYLLRDYFECLAVAERGGSTVFVVKKEIPKDAIESAAETIETMNDATWDDLVEAAAGHMAVYSDRLPEMIRHSTQAFRNRPMRLSGSGFQPVSATDPGPGQQ